MTCRTDMTPAAARSTCTTNGGAWLALMLVLTLAGCVSQPDVPEGTPHDFHIKDSYPEQPMDVSHIPDAVPRVEPRTRAGNKSPYVVLGKTYYVMQDERGFTEEGIGSWYGNKFHGRRTSNGEVYSMYGMTAAHKTLPIPSYVRVTNLENGRQIVVRVNDRGPFHTGRIIDLSYAGASKLGYVNKGTARVRIEVLEPQSPQPGGARTYAAAAGSGLPPAPAPANSAGFELPPNTFLQAGAFSTIKAAEQLRQRLTHLTDLPVQVIVPQSDQLYRVRVGPIADNLVLLDLRERLQQNRLPSPHVVYD